MANGQKGFEARRRNAPMGQLQRAGQMGYAGAPQPPTPGMAPPPGSVGITPNAQPGMPQGLMRGLMPGVPGVLPNPNAVAPLGMVPGQPQPQFNQFGGDQLIRGPMPGAAPGVLPSAGHGLPGPGQFPIGQMPMMQRGDESIRGIVPGAPGVLPSAGSGLPAPGQVPIQRGAAQGPIPRNLLNIAARRLGFMPQFGQFGP